MHSIYKTVAKKPILSSRYLNFAYVFVKNSVPKIHELIIQPLNDTPLPRWYQYQWMISRNVLERPRAHYSEEI